jgi:GT2 family glycosyltransferase
MNEPVVLIPVFATWPGLESIINNSSPGVRVEIIVDDHPGDSRYDGLRTLLASSNRAENNAEASLTFTGVNAGFAATINFGLRQLGGNGKIIILNSDTELTASRWEHLLALARLTPKKNFWGVLPRALSSCPSNNSKGIQTPKEHNLTSELFDFPYPSFEIGIFGSNPSVDGVLLDEALYRIGYGEDSEWCIRAKDLGWKIRAFDWQREYQSSATFGLSKNASKEKARKVIQAMYPRFHEDLESCELQLALEIEARNHSR